MYRLTIFFGNSFRFIIYKRSLDSVDDIATGDVLDSPEFEWGRCKSVRHSKTAQNVCGAQPTNYSVGTWAWGDHSPPSSAEVKNEWSYTYSRDVYIALAPWNRNWTASADLDENGQLEISCNYVEGHF